MSILSVFAADSLWAPLWVLLLAASPVGEVRLSIPVAILYFKMGWGEALVWSLLGNFGVVPLIFAVLPIVERGLRRSATVTRGLDWVFARTRRRHTQRVERYQEFALFLFIATPVPGTGAWSGALVAHLFGLTWAKSWRFFYAGITVACFLVTFLVVAYGWGFGV